MHVSANVPIATKITGASNVLIVIISQHLPRIVVFNVIFKIANIVHLQTFVNNNILVANQAKKHHQQILMFAMIAKSIIVNIVIKMESVNSAKAQL